MTNKTTIVKCPNCGFEMKVGISELGVTLFCTECACKAQFFYDKETGTYNDNPLWQPPDDRDMAMMFRANRFIRDRQMNDNGYQPDKPMTPEQRANPPKGGSGLPPYHFMGSSMRKAKHVTFNVPDLNLKLGAIVTMEGVKYTVVEVKENGVELERKD